MKNRSIWENSKKIFFFGGVVGSGLGGSGWM